MAGPLQLFIDLGDVFTKVLVVSTTGERRLRFPSAVAHRLIKHEADRGKLLLDEARAFPRPTDFEARSHPRSRSYPGAEEFMADKDERPVPGSRFGGWLATKYGADRELLLTHPSPENIDALVRAAILRSPIENHDRAELVFVVDVGVKASAVAHYVETEPAQVAIEAWKFGAKLPRVVKLRITRTLVDAVDCAVAALPPHVSTAGGHRLLVADVGYRRTKLAITSRDGCEYQEELDGLGIEHCVQRILRDGQDQGLVADEFAVLSALEHSQRWIRVAERRFRIGSVVAKSCRAIEEDLAQAVEKAIVQHFQRHGDVCKGVVIMGGGATLVASGVLERLRGSTLGLATTWVSTDSQFSLINGARRIRARVTKTDD